MLFIFQFALELKEKNVLLKNLNVSYPALPEFGNSRAAASLAEAQACEQPVVTGAGHACSSEVTFLFCCHCLTLQLSAPLSLRVCKEALGISHCQTSLLVMLMERVCLLLDAPTVQVTAGR